MVAISLLYRNWPTGLRLDESGITVGAVASSRALSRRPTVYHQTRGVYTCPWPSVHSARVVTDPGELRRLRKSRQYYTLTNRWGPRPDGRQCNIGVMASPFMRAALVAEVYPSGVTGTTVRSGRGYSSFRSHLVPAQLSAMWMVPTRDPAALDTALARLTGAPAGTISPGTA